jgi:hypothetical protein
VNLEVLYSTAHAEFSDTKLLGGGKVAADYLIARRAPTGQVAHHRFGTPKQLVTAKLFRGLVSVIGKVASRLAATIAHNGIYGLRISMLALNLAARYSVD